MAPDESWMTMRRKSPSSPKPSAQLPAKQLPSPLLPLFAPPSAPRPASTLSSAEHAADGCPSPISYWDQPDRTNWDFDNTIYCDSTGCSYDAKKNPRIAKYAVTVTEFDDCSYEEYDDTVFLCGQCNMKCLPKVNGSKIKSKMPIERFLAQHGHRFLNSYHHLPYLDTHTLSILNAPSSWWCTPWALSWAPRRLFHATPVPDAFDGRRQA